MYQFSSSHDPQSCSLGNLLLVGPLAPQPSPAGIQEVPKQREPHGTSLQPLPLALEVRCEGHIVGHPWRGWEAENCVSCSGLCPRAAPGWLQCQDTDTPLPLHSALQLTTLRLFW